jgi:hypothetical protein
MKISDYFGSSRRRFASAAILAFAFTLGLAPSAVRATCTPAVACVGDCDGKGSVTVDEILTMVNIALGNTNVSACLAGDGNCDGSITVDEILTAVNAALSGCPPTGGCGDGVVDTAKGEDCDIGGYCIGGSNAGTACTAEGQCQGNGVCVGGTNLEVACANDAACPGGTCRHCVPAGNSTIPGDATHTCAANCTFETKIHATLDAASNAVLYSELLGGTLGLSLTGTEDVLVGKEKDGQIPLVIIATSVKFDPINVGTIACACVRGVPVKTCGGTLTEADGVTSALDCSDQYTAGNSVCTTAGKPPCAFVNGPGNAASGVIGCAGLTGVNLLFSQDSTGSLVDRAPNSNDPAICNPTDPDHFNPPVPPYPVCGAPPVITLSGSGGAGSAIVINTTAIGQLIVSAPVPCETAPDFCTDAAPIADRGTPQTLPTVTGQAAGYITNANQTDTDTMCNCNGGAISCLPVDCAGGSPQAGPIAINGSTVSCSQVASGSLSGLGLAGTFTQLSSPNTGDIVVTNLQKIH